MTADESRPSDPVAPFVQTDPAIGLGAAARAPFGTRIGEALRRRLGREGGPPGRLGGRAMIVLVAVLGIVAIAVTDQVVPAASAHQAQLRIWLASRAAGLVTLVLLAFQVVTGLLLSHPTNKTLWRLSRAVFPWHDVVWLFVLAFVGAHVVAIVLDPYAGVGLAGVFVPGLSSYRTAPVALGAIALDALLVTGLTARWTKLLPPGVWLVVHRAGIGIFAFGWMHALLAGTDSVPLTFLYLGLGGAVLAAAAHRYWAGDEATAGPTTDRAIPEVTR